MRLSLWRAITAGVTALALAGCGEGAVTRTTSTTGAPPATGGSPARSLPPQQRKPPAPSYPRLLPAATATGPTSFVPAVSWQGATAAWVARTASGLTLLSFDQRLVELRLHAGTTDPGGAGWRFGPALAGSEVQRLIAAFNGAFKLSTGAGGYQSYGRVAAPIRPGIGSIVTYSDGYTDIGTWGREVPSAGHAVVSVRQNLPPLIDHGVPASTLDCRDCWGATLGGVDNPARAALGVTTDGRLIWAAGERVTASQLAGALLGAHVVRAVELDINPEWVAGYLYGHRGGSGPLAPVPAVAGQQGIPGSFLESWSRDFFTVVAR